MGPRFNPRDQHFFNKLIDDGDRFNSDRILLRNMLRIWSELSLLRIGVSDQNPLRNFGPISAICSVAVALAGVFAILINKIRKIMGIFE